MGTHDGHRQRMKSRFTEHGLENFNDVQALELLLFYASPRRDTNPVAHALLERFGSFSGVLDASEEELKTVDGIGDSAAALLRLIPAVSRRYMVDKTPDREPVDTPAAAGRYFVPRFMYEKEEVVYALLLDARKKPICCREMSRGVVNGAEISVRKVVELALSRRASSLILSHNHLSGVALPSAEDEMLTLQLQKALSLVGIDLADHVVVAGCDYVSMREARMM
ncbi:MAG: DNA repair protein RadC [Oscillospiraceae bacterium]|nr:DNA repair protein RadC [Oscillospiraceae bacterium]